MNDGVDILDGVATENFLEKGTLENKIIVHTEVMEDHEREACSLCLKKS